MRKGIARGAIGILSAVGVASLLGLLALELEQRRATLDELDAVRRLGTLRADAAIVHVWVEELLSNDRVDEEDLRRRLEGLPSLLAELPAGVDTEDLRAQVSLLQIEVKRFWALTEDRLDGWARGFQVGIGSGLDVEYDQAFNELLARSVRVGATLEAGRAAVELRQARRFQWLLALCGLSLLAAAGLYLEWERERRMALRELETTERQLHRSQKIDVLGRLAGGLAHDINNYLAAIRSQLELAELELDDIPQGDVRRRLHSAKGTAARAGALIERLLTLGSRVPAGDDRVDVTHLLEQMRPMLDSAAPAGVGLEVRLDRSLWPVRASLSAVEQVLLNLVLNAFDAVKGRGTVVIEGRNLGAAEAGRAGGDRVEILVRDDGCGIPAEDLPRIFEPFWSSKGGSRESAGHAGLGLAVVASVMERTSGTVEVESEEGRGTTFVLRFPRSVKPKDVLETPVSEDRR